jgi:FkbM family methyltransferase
MTQEYPSSLVEELIASHTETVRDIERQFEAGIALYGAGFVGGWALNYLRGQGATISALIDRDPAKQGAQVNGVEIHAPHSDVAARASALLITARHAVPEVARAMARPGRTLMSFEAFFVVRNYARLAAVRDQLLGDPYSVETFNAILVAMLTSSTKHCRRVMVKDMYFGLPEFSGNFEEIFVDAGAFVGDTVERFIWENLGTFRQIHAFEPGRRQFAGLQQRMERLAREWAFNPESVALVQAGLSSGASRMVSTFEGDFPLRHGLSAAPTGAEVAGGEGSLAEVMSLDDYLAGRPITFLKADVEGMELDLLRGAVKTLQRYRPKLAVCVYHYPSDLFEIPELIRALVPDYRFSLRQHAPIFGDFVLYAWIEPPT